MQINRNMSRTIYRQNTVDGVPTSKFSLIEEHTLVVSGQDNPLYRRDIASGRAATNPYDKSMVTEHFRPLTTSVTNFGKVRVNSYNPIQFAPFDSPIWDTIVTQDYQGAAVRKALTKIRKTRETDFNGFVFLGELRSTLQFLRSPYKKLRTSLESFARTHKHQVDKYRDLRAKRNQYRLGDLRSRMSRTEQRFMESIPNELNNSFLETSYALRPLISDVQNIARIAGDLHNIDEVQRQFSQEKYFASKIVTWPQVPLLYLEAAQAYPTYRFVKIGREKWTVGVFRKGSSDEIIPRLRQASQFSLGDVAPAIWELIPWSWAVDGIANIGQLINLWTTDTRGVRFSARTVVQERRIELINISYTSDKPDFQVLEQPEYRGCRQVISRRNQLPNIGFEDLAKHFSLRLPPLQTAMGTASALLQRFYFRK